MLHQLNTNNFKLITNRLRYMIIMKKFNLNYNNSMNFGKKELHAIKIFTLYLVYL
jgi:hypothetical protein